jgi:predicted DNA-binding transcriptional regulator AlpA
MTTRPYEREGCSGRADPANSRRTPAEHTAAVDAAYRAANSEWTTETVRALGMTTSLETAAEILGIGRTLAYTLVRDGQFPVRVLRLGRRVLIPIPELLKLLGAD